MNIKIILLKYQIKIIKITKYIAYTCTYDKISIRNISSLVLHVKKMFRVYNDDKCIIHFKYPDNDDKITGEMINDSLLRGLVFLLLAIIVICYISSYAQILLWLKLNKYIININQT
ncbi:hypothetical protein BCR32DRAFT_239770 [Anaeromyces robustus]|uniref:Uncharacterized protein n=1 Tax=Anaeromyces robustus TaxID=1754192 RepID=A0A1Y1XQ51_9FUNG|nr:hypothetical protein BCR32DRAFT_239770 [Anaeromyces robustus]|eukprot:ORX87863.1 hypothetical protein BCR32DRAFT_239770 [Anaeromyces robustus]